MRRWTCSCSAACARVCRTWCWRPWPWRFRWFRTRIAGIPRLIEDGRNGLLVEPGSIDALAAAIARTINDPRSGTGSREKVARPSSRITALRSGWISFAPSMTSFSSASRSRSRQERWPRHDDFRDSRLPRSASCWQSELRLPAGGMGELRPRAGTSLNSAIIRPGRRSCGGGWPGSLCSGGRGRRRGPRAAAAGLLEEPPLRPVPGGPALPQLWRRHQHATTRRPGC